MKTAQTGRLALVAAAMFAASPLVLAETPAAGAVSPDVTSATAPRYEAKWASLDQRPTPVWFSDAKFGIFIHLGVYSVPAWGKVGEYAEWYWQRIESKAPDDAVWRAYHDANYGAHFSYQDFAPQLRLQLYDPAHWADLFAKAGAKYVVLTSKHHEGFALWPSADASRTWGRPWNAVEIGPKRDVLGELATATRARGLKFGFYYSLYEWFNPLWLTDRKRYVTEHMYPQFKDVVTRYRPSIIFSDGEWEMTSQQWRSEELLAWLFNESPSRDDVVVNDRWGSETRHKHGGYWTTEYGAGLPDDRHPWEESRGMAFSYGYNRAERAEDYKSTREFILILTDLVSRGGNFLLDIGPASDGTIPLLMEQRLLEIGAWLRVNGEAIYGTRFAGRSCQWSAGERPPQAYGDYRVPYNVLDVVGQPHGGKAVKELFFTKKPDALYAISPGWPGKEVVVRNVRVQRDTRVTMLGVSGELKTRRKGDSLMITTPVVTPDNGPCQYAYAFKITDATLLPEK
jgi:alpha-L-fucosidase